MLKMMAIWCLKSYPSKLESVTGWSTTTTTKDGVSPCYKIKFTETHMSVTGFQIIVHNQQNRTFMLHSYVATYSKKNGPHCYALAVFSSYTYSIWFEWIAALMFTLLGALETLNSSTHLLHLDRMRDPLLCICSQMTLRLWELTVSHVFPSQL